MIYVVSNIHGNYEKFKQLLEKISFSEDDIMYILGDLVDFGDESMALIEDVSMRMNVYSVSGEHDALAYRMLAGFDDILASSSSIVRLVGSIELSLTSLFESPSNPSAEW